MNSFSELRLASNARTDTSSGAVEILHAGRWGNICSKNWGDYEALVACKQLGYRGGSVDSNAILVDINEVTWLTEVRCKGLETRLDLCYHGPWAGDCDPGDVSAVRCGRLLLFLW